MEIYLQQEDKAKGLFSTVVIGKVTQIPELYQKKSLRKGDVDGSRLTLERDSFGRTFYLEMTPSSSGSNRIILTAISNNQKFLEKTLDKIVQDIGFTEEFAADNNTFDVLKYQAREILERYYRKMYLKE